MLLEHLHEDQEAREECMQQDDHLVPFPSHCPPCSFLFGRWFLYLLVPILFFGVGGSTPIPPKLYGEVTSPLYPKTYPNNFETTTVITVPKGYRIKLVFWYFDLEPSEGCFYDYVKVDGKTRESGEGSLHLEI